MSDIIQDFKEALKKVAPHTRLAEHPQIINGTLYVTKEQFNGLHKWAAEQTVDHLSIDRTVQAASGLPVVVLKPGESIKRDDGTHLICTYWGELFTINFPAPPSIAHISLSNPHKYANRLQQVAGDEEYTFNRVEKD